MNHMPPNTRDRLVQSAARLFRQKGYHGVGLTEILTDAAAPKGSLYHHFPNGKPDLAIAAAEWASAGMLQIIDEAFAEAETYREGATTLCYKLAKFFDLSQQWDGCPVSHVLFDGPANKVFRTRANVIFSRWITAIATHAAQLDIPGTDAPELAETLLMTIQGSWVLARARGSSDVIRQIPQRLFH